jgi:hypothetical protein
MSLTASRLLRRLKRYGIMLAIILFAHPAFSQTPVQYRFTYSATTFGEEMTVDPSSGQLLYRPITIQPFTFQIVSDGFIGLGAFPISAFAIHDGSYTYVFDRAYACGRTGPASTLIFLSGDIRLLGDCVGGSFSFEAGHNTGNPYAFFFVNLPTPLPTSAAIYNLPGGINRGEPFPNVLGAEVSAELCGINLVCAVDRLFSGNLTLEVRDCFGTGQIQLWTLSQDSSTWTVQINGVDPRQPTHTPFKWIWGDGAVTTGWFPQTHTYVGAAAGDPHIVTVIATEDDGTIDCAELTVFLSGTAPLTITTSSLPSITAGQTYTSTLQATGGTPPYSWSVRGRSGLLPYGFFPEHVTFNNATISTDATRVTAGIYRLTFSVTDAVGTNAAADLDLEVSCNDFDLDNLNAQYVLDGVLDITGRVLTAPACQDFTRSFPAFNDGLSVWALVRSPLTTNQGDGLTAWLQALALSQAPGGPHREITSVYRTPNHNAQISVLAARTSRHMWGDAVDLNNNTNSMDEWNAMLAAARDAGMDHYENVAAICSVPNGCTNGVPRHFHSEWRDSGAGAFQHGPGGQ